MTRQSQHDAIPKGTRLVGQGFVFMQDNAPKILVNSASNGEQHFRQLKCWMAQLVELNPMELVWDELNNP